jgi:glycerophosphoryl diester phosphodiesterase
MRVEAVVIARSCVGLLLLLGAAAGSTATGPPELEIQGHRGFRGRHPENTLPGFRAALALGISTLELDIQLTRDRVIVVHHDARLVHKRCMDDAGGRVPRDAIHDLDYDRLATIDCGTRTASSFPEQASAPGARIPRLDQVLELARDAAYPVRLSIEIKMQRPRNGPPADEVAALTVQAIEAYGLTSRTTIQSFAPAALLAVQRLSPDMDRAILVRSRSAYDGMVERSAATILSPRYDGLRRQDVERMHDRGIRVIPWTVNRPEALRRMIGWNVDGVITDYPDLALEILTEVAAETPTAP